ncbi:hypothetical protein Bca4012_048312 [Brassica carinata]
MAKTMRTMRAPNKNGQRKLKSYPLLAAQKAGGERRSVYQFDLVSFSLSRKTSPSSSPRRWLSSRRKSLTISLSVCFVGDKGLLSLYVDLLESEGSILFRGGSRRRSILSVTFLNGDGALGRQLSSIRSGKAFSFMFFNDPCLRLSKA